MIVQLTGKPIRFNEDGVVLDVGGVGYFVYCTRPTVARLQQTAQANPDAFLTLQINQQYRLIQQRDFDMMLFGFVEESESKAFDILLGVQGVGAKMALSMLSALTPGQLAQAIMLDDKALLTQADGVGPKLAGRLVTELKDKVDALPLSAAPAQPVDAVVPKVKASKASAVAAAAPAADPAMANDAIVRDSLSALENLGYNKTQAYQIVMDVIQANDGEGLATGEVIRQALQRLAA